jgi:flagellar M-ring protein FliF
VTNLIPLAQGHDDKVEVKDPRPDVQVVTFQHLASAPIAPPAFADQALFWLSQYWTTLGMVVLGLVSLLILRSIARSIPAAAPRPEAAPAMSAATTIDSESSPVVEPVRERQDAATRLKRRAKGGPSLRDELVDIVREDPDAAANILRNWIGAAT